MLKYINYVILSSTFNENTKIPLKLQTLSIKLLLSFTVNLKKSSYIPGETLVEDTIRLFMLIYGNLIFLIFIK